MVLFPEYTRYTSTDNQDPRSGHGLRVLLTCPLTPSERMSQIMGLWLGLKAFNEQNDFIAPPPPTVPKPSKPLGPFGHMVAFVTKLQQARIRWRGRGATDRHTQREGGEGGQAGECLLSLMPNGWQIVFYYRSGSGTTLRRPLGQKE